VRIVALRDKYLRDQTIQVGIAGLCASAPGCLTGAPRDRPGIATAIASAAGARKAELADPRLAERATGYVVGGISPLGQRKQLPVYLDASATVLEAIIVNGGRRGLQVVVKPVDLVTLAGGVVLPLCA